MSLTPPLPPGSELKALLQDVERLNAALEQNPDLLSDTRLKDLELTGLVLKNATLSNLHWRNVRLIDAQLTEVTIQSSRWIGVQFKESTFHKVTFRDVKMTVDKSVYHGNTKFLGGIMDDVRFYDAELWDIDMIGLKKSRIWFERVKLKREDLPPTSPDGKWGNRLLRTTVSYQGF